MSSGRVGQLSAGSTAGHGLFAPPPWLDEEGQKRFQRNMVRDVRLHQLRAPQDFYIVDPKTGMTNPKRCDPYRIPTPCDFTGRMCPHCDFNMSNAVMVVHSTHICKACKKTSVVVKGQYTDIQGIRTWYYLECMEE